MLATYRSYGFVGPRLGLYVGNLQVYGTCWTQLGAVCWQPTGCMGLVGPSIGLKVSNLQVLWGMLDPAWVCLLATYRSCEACWTQLGAVCWQPTGLMRLVGSSLGLYVGNLQVLSGMLDPVWGSMLATYRSYAACWTQLAAVCWQPTGRMGLVGNLQVSGGLLDPARGCMLTTYMSFMFYWTQLGAVHARCCMLATYRSYGACWIQLGAVCWQPTGLMGLVEPSLGRYVGNLQILWGLLDPAWGCMLATYRS